jgi:hypothetical protein
VAEVTVSKWIDADGDPDTRFDRVGADGWEFELGVSVGTVVEEINDARWTVSYGPEGTTATLTEVAQEGFEFLDFLCLEFSSGEIEIGTREGNSVTFPVRVTDVTVPTYHCNFINTASDPLAATITAEKVIDADASSNRSTFTNSGTTSGSLTAGSSS